MRILSRLPFPSVLLAFLGFSFSSTVYGGQDLPRLYSSHAKSSSFLKSAWNKYNENYHPNYVLDDNPKTAWVEGVDGNGEGETLLIPFSPLSSAKKVRLKIRNGYQKSENLMKANSAPKEILV